MTAQLIRQQAMQIPVPSGIEGELREAYQLARVIDQYLLETYFPSQSPPGKQQIEDEIDRILLEFKNDIISELQGLDAKYEKLREDRVEGKKNIFIYAGAKKLFFANRYTRIISELLGHRLEEIANIDTSKVFDSEKGFDTSIKIKGIDKFILLESGNIAHVQIKTKKDTLTGSQSPRSVNELIIHPHPIFAAALDLGKGWTFPPEYKKHVKRVTGDEFWNMIGIDYNLVLRKISACILEIEQILYP